MTCLYRHRPTKTTQERSWTPDRIANGILTWHIWPGFEGTHCDKCGCEMNVLGMSYGHRCPDCDPDREHRSMISLCGHGCVPFDEPRFGPTRATISRGGGRAMEISESKREYAIGTRVMLHDYWYGHGRNDYPIETGTVVQWDIEDSYPGRRYYRVDVDGGQKFKQVPESNMAPFRKFADGEAVSVRHLDGWVLAKVTHLVNDEKSYFLYRQHQYEVEVLAKTAFPVRGAEGVSSMLRKSIFDGTVREVDIRPSTNPECRWCKGKGEVALATSVKKCLDCWPE